MAYKIGFTAGGAESAEQENTSHAAALQTKPRKSVAEVYFEESHRTLAYYNDRFDLHEGDWVYVDGKLAGQRGRVTQVNYSFKIKLSEYKRVIAVVDTNVHGQFFFAGSHFVTFDRAALPTDQIALWFKAPETDGEVYESGSDDAGFALADPAGMHISAAVAERGQEYYFENRVRYICIDGTKGYAITEGTKPYEVEFEYVDGMVYNLTCDCFCSYACKHEFAAMLQLRETLGIIEKNYAEEFARTGYFAAVNKALFFAFAVDGKECGSFTI